MKEIWIIGAGRFGWLAFQRLSEKKKHTRFILVDPVKENLSRWQGPKLIIYLGDGVDFLNEHLQGESRPDWIIPALPVHLAGQWLLARLGPMQIQRITIPEEIEHYLPNPIRGAGGDLYVSHADFRCPHDCAEPRDLCTVTGEKRKKNMFEVLKGIRFDPFQPVVIRSRQLGPGVGGYRPRQIYELLEKVKQLSGPLLLSTACRCHGVITGLHKK